MKEKKKKKEKNEEKERTISACPAQYTSRTRFLYNIYSFLYRNNFSLAPLSTSPSISSSLHSCCCIVVVVARIGIYV